MDIESCLWSFREGIGDCEVRVRVRVRVLGTGSVGDDDGMVAVM